MMPIILLISTMLLFAGLLEHQRHQQRLKKIPIRIHINGTRGKSLLTRMIVDLFRYEGWAAAAKVTGEQPQFYSSQTGWAMWRRIAPARIKENLRFVKTAYLHHPKAIVVENMALAPENQYAAETHMIQSTVSIVTNIREDHLEVMGADRTRVGETLSRCIPQNGTLLIPEAELLPTIKKQANESENTIITVPVSNQKNLRTLNVFDSSFALLEQIKEHFHISTESFDKTVTDWQRQLQPHHFLLPLPNTNSQQFLVNLFTCNDVQSARELIHSLQQSETIHPPYDIILTCRGDRPLRTIAFLEWLGSSEYIYRLVLAGTVPKLAVRRIIHSSPPLKNAVSFSRRMNPHRILSSLQHGTTYVLGLGNYVNTGERILDYLQGN
ncbi:hypothetical protein JW960_16050 [candidate division KSB1 bacterium]|nr:hypothetical protein [candidate division KSB1 bacterium]